MEHERIRFQVLLPGSASRFCFQVPLPSSAFKLTIAVSKLEDGLSLLDNLQDIPELDFVIATGRLAQIGSSRESVPKIYQRFSLGFVLSFFRSILNQPFDGFVE